MRKLPYLLAAAALSGLALIATPSSAGPLASGLMGSNAALPQMDEGLIQKVHGWHCRKRFSNYRGWHRHRRACDDYGYHRGYYYGHPGYGFGFPLFSFGIYDDDDDHRHHRRWRRHHKNW